MTVKRVTTLSILVAVAMVLSFVESQIPLPLPVPGVKLGLANIAVIFTLYRLGVPEAAGVSLVRVLLVSLLFGTLPAFLYSVSGAAVSFLAMCLLRRCGRFSAVGVSVAGGVFHNLGQLAAVALVMGTSSLLWYFPVLLVSGTLAGVAVGLLSALLIRKIPGGSGKE